MITNTGKAILAKYLIGQAPSYASYIAIGCGPKPLPATEDLSTHDFSDKTKLDFEMFRVPIISRGYVHEDGASQIVFTAELPTEERYEISEVGVYSAGSNPSAGAYDSKTIYSFISSENWEYHGNSVVSIPLIIEPLDGVLNDNIINQVSPVFQTNADNRVFTNNNRIARYERSRFLNNVVMMAGNNAILDKFVEITGVTASAGVLTYQTALPHLMKAGDVTTITGISPTKYNLSGVTILGAPTPTSFTVTSSLTGAYSSGGAATTNHIIVKSGSHHIHTTNASIDFSKNSPSDELSLAFSIVNKNGTASSIPDNVKILIEFASSDNPNSANIDYAKFEIDIDNGTSTGQHDLENNRYVIATSKIQDLLKTSTFGWNSVNIAKIYVQVTDGGQPSDQYYVALDALRLDNVSSINPLYGLTGYSIIKNTDAHTILKSTNTSSLVEFRFAMDVQ
jgi:hypothetical protein